ncbi:hypothetical protein CWATWH8502_2285 [Crocosphaera watsonii WH 8502]|uniref:Uncharacterized protein n=3 Tax=Crocosphaera watsonii TaxID=263511 RepID=G5J8Z6_CROWT|nr:MULTISPECIES: hypothetical protein [Crocosphaera]EHJ11332.1 hypothetical protein CWATWH0003_3915 [Crocosphaera watsonii WH 0003]MCH2247212.1 hypothetical protein [Crocosphaera sp.]CCQ50289.1 hypothetical protein CWATWH8502_2285 [Crocosphaera watsonii WH 8502]CCQ55239.1 hypothetical protein CWATWH0005_5909 [Crocosphaera watsonii WH 0005]
MRGISLDKTSVKIIPTITSWWVIAVELKADIILELLEKQASGNEMMWNLDENI